MKSNKTTAKRSVPHRLHDQISLYLFIYLFIYFIGSRDMQIFNALFIFIFYSYFLILFV